MKQRTLSGWAIFHSSDFFFEKFVILQMEEAIVATEKC